MGKKSTRQKRKNRQKKIEVGKEGKRKKSMRDYVAFLRVKKRRRRDKKKRDRASAASDTEMAQCPAGYAPRLFWPSSYFYGFMGNGRNLWRSIYRATQRAPGTFASSWVAVASPLVTDPLPALPLSLSSLPLSLSVVRFHPLRTIVLLIFQSCAEKERVARLPRPTAASFFHWPRLVQ